jgi:pimeloyl-ACP methyl ester carboxylesterase
MFDAIIEQVTGKMQVWALHGSASSPGIWKPLADALAGRHSIRAVALAGYHGAKMAPKAGLASRAVPVIAELEAQERSVHLVGHSFGAAVALKVAAMRPDLVASLTLYEPMLPSLIAGEKTDEERLAMSEIGAVATRLTAAVASGASEDGMAQFFDFWAGTDFWSKLGPERRARLAAQSVTVMADFADAYIEPMGFDDLAQIEVPVVLMQGSRSPKIIAAVSRRLLAGLPDAVHIVLNEADHLAPISEPERVIDVVDAHIRMVEERTEAKCVGLAA